LEFCSASVARGKEATSIGTASGCAGVEEPSATAREPERRAVGDALLRGFERRGVGTEPACAGRAAAAAFCVVVCVAASGASNSCASSSPGKAARGESATCVEAPKMRNASARTGSPLIAVAPPCRRVSKEGRIATTGSPLCERSICGNWWRWL